MKADSLANRLRQFAESKKYTKEYAYAIYTQAGIEISKKNFHLADSVSRLALKIFQNLNDEMYISMAFELIGEAFLGLMQLDSAEYYYHKAFVIKEKINDEEGKAYCLNSLGIVNDYRTDYPNAILNYQKAATIFEKYKNDEMLSDIYNNLSIVSSNLGHFDEAVNYIKKAIALNKKIGHEYNLPLNYVCLASYYISQDCLQEGMDYAELSLKESNRLNSHFVKAYAYSTLGDANLQLGELSKAENYYRQFLAIAQGLFGDFEISTVKMKLAEVYYKKGDFNPAVLLLEKALPVFWKFKAKKELSEGYALLAKIHAAGNQFAKAYIYIQKADSLQSLYLNKKNLQQIEELKTKYQVEKKEAENALLKKDRELQMETIRARNRHIQFMGIGLLMAFALLLLVYRNYRLKSRANQLLAQKNDQILTLARENNHRIKNNLELLSSMMQMQIRRLDSPELKDVIKESENRVQTLAILEKELKMGDAETKVELEQYLEKIIQNIRWFYASGGKDLDIELNVPPTEIDADKAMRIGLIINELITNSVKHAFDDRQESPLISIDWKEAGDGSVSLIYKDNGVGFDANIHPDETNSLGLRLIRNLLIQLHGSWQIRNETGAVFSFSFPNLKKSA